MLVVMTIVIATSRGANVLIRAPIHIYSSADGVAYVQLETFSSFEHPTRTARIRRF